MILRINLVRWDVQQSLPAPTGREHFHFISTVTESHERSRAARSAATEDEELSSKMRHEGFKRDERPCSVYQMM